MSCNTTSECSHKAVPTKAGDFSAAYLKNVHRRRKSQQQI
jgi:hypothetical protein